MKKTEKKNDGAKANVEEKKEYGVAWIVGNCKGYMTKIAPAVSDVNRCRSAGFFLRYEAGPLINGSSSISFKWYPNGQGMEEKKKKSDETAKVLAKSFGGKDNG